MTYEPKEETKHNEINTNTDMTSMAVDWHNKFIHMAVDYKAVQMYFKKLKDLINDDNQFREAIGELIMAIEHTWDYAGDSKNDKHAG